jgi:hypothetical protein
MVIIDCTNHIPIDEESPPSSYERVMTNNNHIDLRIQDRIYFFLK